MRGRHFNIDIMVLRVFNISQITVATYKINSFLSRFASMYNTAQILKMLKAKKPELEIKYPISELGLFGSYARGDHNPQSDIDILVDFNGWEGDNTGARKLAEFLQ
jgi:predicted nucleotidyltransferase